MTIYVPVIVDGVAREKDIRESVTYEKERKKGVHRASLEPREVPHQTVTDVAERLPVSSTRHEASEV